jgi:enolase-phosphatase E1
MTQVYLLDVEGTTSPVSLVSEQLFPYARKHLASYLHAHDCEAVVQADLALLYEENRAETDPSAPRIENAASVDQAMAYLLWLMDRDRKSTALKSLQGKVWKNGYEAGELLGTVFPDVPPALARWAAKGRVAIYSSGSVEAQKLIFGHSSAGDLTPLLSGYFDTRVGPKTAAASYAAIAAALGVATSDILFVSDLPRELNPARQAGCATRLSLRQGNAPVADAEGHAAIHSFAEIP